MQTDTSDLKDTVIRPIVKPNQGDWIFTCSMKPLQFDHFIEKSPNDYSRGKDTVEEWEIFLKFDDFQTMEGSHHSRRNCSLKIITEAYALWFIKNQIWEIYDKVKSDDTIPEDQVWIEYEKTIRQKCDKDGIIYEGF